MTSAERRRNRVTPRRYRWLRPDVWLAIPNRFKTILVSYPTQPIELFAGIGSILRGIWWMMADPGVDAAARMLERLIPTWSMGVVLTSLGLLQILGVGIKSVGMRLISAALISGCTMLILATTLVVEPRNRSLPALVLIMLMEFAVTIRVGPWTDYPFGGKRDRTGLVSIKMMEAVAGAGLFALVVKQVAQRVTNSGLWIPVIMSGLVTIGTLVLNNYFQNKRVSRREDLQAPARELKLVQLVQDEGEQIRKELRLEVEYKGKEIDRLRLLLATREAHIRSLDEQLLVALTSLRHCREDCERMRGGESTLKMG